MESAGIVQNSMELGLIPWTWTWSGSAAGAVPVVVVTALSEGAIQMIWLARLRQLVAVTAALILATAGVAVSGRQRPAPEGVRERETAGILVPGEDGKQIALERTREQAKPAAPPKAGAGGAAVPNIAANRALAMEQLALIDQALAMLDRLFENSTIRFSDPRFSLWALRKVETLRKIGAGKAEIVAALESYINRLKQEDAAVENDHQSARASQVDVHDVRFRRLEAEI